MCIIRRCVNSRALLRSVENRVKGFLAITGIWFTGHNARRQKHPDASSLCTVAGRAGGTQVLRTFYGTRRYDLLAIQRLLTRSCEIPIYALRGLLCPTYLCYYIYMRNRFFIAATLKQIYDRWCVCLLWEIWYLRYIYLADTDRYFWLTLRN